MQAAACRQIREDWHRWLCSSLSLLTVSMKRSTSSLRWLRVGHVRHVRAADGCATASWCPAQPARTKKQICLRACADGWCITLHRSCWESSNAVAYDSRLWALARWVRVLAFGTVARRESFSMGSRDHVHAPTKGFVSRSAHKTIYRIDNKVQ